ncbi:MAG: tRNA (guanosine(37)-N1)-methyltransferase TrmD [Patescibacteria group bacterium]|nr:tRNA (guanosine(37)-N1)-methyltransferase TrmD [Patescibacteria group bacterium]
MIFDLITIFPEIFDSYLKKSLIVRSQQKKIIKINIHNLRKWATGRHQTVDDKPFGGGRGMVLKIEPIYRCVQQILGKRYKILDKKSKTYHLKPKTSIVLFTPRGKKFNQRIATEFSKLDRLVLICGRYEGVDERVAKYIADDCLSIGNYVLMGGELPALVVVETVVRLLPGVIGKSELLRERITEKKGFREYPQYTRPEVFEINGKKLKVPKVLLSGHHKKIEEWRKKHSKIIEK